MREVLAELAFFFIAVFVILFVGSSISLTVGTTSVSVPQEVSGSW